jgi:molybdopterin synthase sulfur carrier subunit
MIEVVLPSPLRKLAGISGPVLLEVAGAPTPSALLDTLERTYPTLRGTIRDHATGKRRAYLRFFACGEDLSHAPMDAPLPAAVSAGDEPFLVVGAMSGG